MKILEGIGTQYPDADLPPPPFPSFPQKWKTENGEKKIENGENNTLGLRQENESAFRPSQSTSLTHWCDVMGGWWAGGRPLKVGRHAHPLVGGWIWWWAMGWVALVGGGWVWPPTSLRSGNSTNFLLIQPQYPPSHISLESVPTPCSCYTSALRFSLLTQLHLLRNYSVFYCIYPEREI